MEPQTKPQTREQFLKSLFVTKEHDNYLSEKDAQRKLASGISKGVEAISPSYGPSGSNAILEVELNPGHFITNDGKAILDAIKLSDKVENIGLEILKEITAKSEKESGDGRKTSVILAGAILKEGLKAKGSPMDIKRSLDECLPIIIKSIDDQTTEIGTDKIGQIATISSENESIGKTFQEIYTAIGKDGIVEIDNSNLPITSYEIMEGVRLRNCGWMYDYMCNDNKGHVATFKNPYVLICKEKISNLNALGNVMEHVSKAGRSELVIFCDEIDVTISQALAYRHIGQTPNGQPIPSFKTLVIKAPTLWKDWLFEDFAKITGSTIIDPSIGRSLKSFQLSYLGMCDKVVARKDETVVLGIKDISKHIEKLEEENTEDSKLRLAWLKTKTAILKLGANSDSELGHLRGKATDARNASYLALNGGVVKGGGQAYVYAAGEMPDTIGGKILEKALTAPYTQICENIGTPTVNFKGIIDPAIVVKNSITNAISVVGTLLTTKLVITKCHF